MKHTVEFVEPRGLYGQDGSPLAASDFVFRVDGLRVVVWVESGAIQTLDGGQLSPNEVIDFAREWVEIEMARFGELADGTILTFGEGARDQVAKRLGCLDRFYASYGKASR